MSRLRVIDAGRVNALRSQALWHGIAEAMTAETDPTLSLCQPGEPYVGVGYHRSLAELDREACERRGLPIIRRQIGGGPVYIDSDQLFFQITLPARRAPRRVDRLYALLLEPAVAAFRALGLDARIRGLNDISIADRRLSGTGAGRIKDGVTVVGNVIFRFPHRSMAEVLALPTRAMRQECLQLMERHVTSLESEGLARVTTNDARVALVDAYARGFDSAAVPETLRPEESAAIRRWEARFSTRQWLDGPDPAPPSHAARQIKISADVWLYVAARDGLELQASFCGGRIENPRISSPRLNGAGEEMARRLAGCPIGDLARRLTPFGNPGDRVLELLEAGAVLR